MYYVFIISVHYAINFLIYKSIIFYMIETKATILCALCGIKFTPQMGSICPTCTIKSLQEEKMLEGQQINYCRYCERFQRPPWINCQRQSQQMLGMLLKRIKGLNKVEMQSAAFIWTEPHSKRMKLKVVFNREVNQNMKIQVVEIVEFVEKYGQCNDCRKKFTPHDWVAMVQIRQQSSHKKTILNLEQILLKQNILEKVIKTEQAEGGMDMYFSTDHDAIRLVDFLKGRFPVQLVKSSKLISHNVRDNTSNIKITYCCTIPRICKDDLIRIPRKLSKELGSCCEVLLCIKVSASLHFLDVATFRKIQISSMQYFLYENEIEIFSIKIYGKKFNILDCETKQAQTPQKYPSFGLTIMKQDEYLQLYSKSHFSEEPGNQLIGFQLNQIQNIEGVKNMPDYLMVLKVKNKENKKKMKSNRRKKQAELKRKQSQAISRQGQRQARNEQVDSEEQWESQQGEQQQQNEEKQVKNQEEKKEEKQVQGNQQSKA